MYDVHMPSSDPYNLERFATAQDAGSMYDRAVSELRAGRKISHWMWFIFPQIAGLGYSAMARRYAIASLDEARAYFRHPVLGQRLIECARILAESKAPSAVHILGEVDALKLRSSMTLFLHAAPDEPVFKQVLARFFSGVPDVTTEQRLQIQD